MRNFRTYKLNPLHALPLLLIACAGCVVQRGVDFGHWAQSGENIAQINFVEPRVASPTPLSSSVKQIVIFPVISSMDQPYLDTLNNNLLQEAHSYFKAVAIPLERNGKMAEFITKENLYPMDSLLNAHEAARLGQLMNASHALCIRVRSYRMDPPQILSLELTLVDTSTFQKVLEMNALYNSSEQGVILALDQYLRGRSSRKYSKNSLDVILHSPSEYGAFVAAQCMHALSDKIWDIPRQLKRSGYSSDNKTGK